MTGQRRVARDAGLSLVAVISLGLTRLLYNVVVGHGAGQTVLGRVNTQISVAMLVTLLVSAGTAAAATKFVPAALSREGETQAQAVLRLLTRWTVAGTLLTVLVLGLCFPLVLPGAGGTALALTLALTAAYAAYSFVKGALYGCGRVRRYMLLELAGDALAVAAVVAFVLTGVRLLLLPLVLGYALVAAAGWPGLRLGSRPAAGQARLTRLRVPGREMAGFVAMACVGTLASTGFLQLSMVFAQRYGTATQAGDYAAALALTAPAYVLPRALSLALFPAMASAHGRREEEPIRRQADLATRLLLLGTLPLFVAAVLLAEPLLAVFFGSGFTSGRAVLELLLLATYVSIVPVAATNSLTAAEARLVSVPMIASVAGLLLGVGLWAGFGPRYGAVAVAAGYLAGSLVQAAVPLLVAWRRYRQRWAGLLGRALALCLLAAALWYAVHRIAVGVAGGLVLDAAAVVVFVLVWLAVCRGELRLLAPAVRQARDLSAVRDRRRRPASAPAPVLAPPGAPPPPGRSARSRPAPPSRRPPPPAG